MRLTLPIRVQGHSARGEPWEEMTLVRDVSPSGVAFLLKRPLSRGNVVFLSLPLPKRFRSYDLMEPSYRVYGLVRNVAPAGPAYRIGVMFLGKHPPREHDGDPGSLFLLPSDARPARDRRQFPRLDIFVNVRLRGVARAALEGQEERTIAENIGKGGARVMTTLAVSKGDLLIFEEVDGSFRTRAEVRNKYVAADNITRLNLAFLDEQAPDRLVAPG